MEDLDEDDSDAWMAGTEGEKLNSCLLCNGSRQLAGAALSQHWCLHP